MEETPDSTQLGERIGRSELGYPDNQDGQDSRQGRRHVQGNRRVWRMVGEVDYPCADRENRACHEAGEQRRCAADDRIEQCATSAATMHPDTSPAPPRNAACPSGRCSGSSQDLVAARMETSLTATPMAPPSRVTLMISLRSLADGRQLVRTGRCAVTVRIISLLRHSGQVDLTREVTARIVARRNLSERRLTDAAYLLGERAARVKVASGRRVRRVRDLSFERGAPRADLGVRNRYG